MVKSQELCWQQTGGFSYKGIDFFGGVREGFVHVISEYYDVVIVEINLAGLKEKNLQMA